MMKKEGYVVIKILHNYANKKLLDKKLVWYLIVDYAKGCMKF